MKNEYFSCLYLLLFLPFLLIFPFFLLLLSPSLERFENKMIILKNVGCFFFLSLSQLSESFF